MSVGRTKLFLNRSGYEMDADNSNLLFSKVVTHPRTKKLTQHYVLILAFM